MTTYTNIQKPSGTTYRNINLVGKQQYDESSITYDEASVYYDGLNPNQYTKSTKPSGTSYTNIPKP